MTCKVCNDTKKVVYDTSHLGEASGWNPGVVTMACSHCISREDAVSVAVEVAALCDERDKWSPLALALLACKFVPDVAPKEVEQYLQSDKNIFKSVYYSGLWELK